MKKQSKQHVDVSTITEQQLYLGSYDDESFQ